MAQSLETQVPRSTFKIVLVGDTNVGKTTFVKRHQSGDFEKNHIPTMGVEVYPLPFALEGKNGKCFVILNMWDCAGDENYKGLEDGYYIGAKGAILMYDVTNDSTFKSLKKYKKNIDFVTDGVPMVLVGHKCDLIEEPSILKLDSVVAQYYVSSKSNYNYEKPLLTLIRKLMGDDSLHFSTN